VGTGLSVEAHFATYRMAIAQISAGASRSMSQAVSIYAHFRVYFRAIGKTTPSTKPCIHITTGLVKAHIDIYIVCTMGNTCPGSSTVITRVVTSCIPVITGTTIVIARPICIAG